MVQETPPDALLRRHFLAGAAGIAGLAPFMETAQTPAEPGPLPGVAVDSDVRIALETIMQLSGRRRTYSGRAHSMLPPA